MLTDQDLATLVQAPKRIVRKTPDRGLREESGHKRCELELQPRAHHGGAFEAFIRHSSQFVENFSFGLKYRPDGSPPRTLVLVRYNGPHGETSQAEDGHYTKPHIHRLTADALAEGSVQPRPTDRELTNRYASFEQAIVVFCEDAGIENYSDYFPQALQGILFNGHR